MKPSKSCDEYISGLYAAMFFDIVSHFPELRTDSMRDNKRLLLAIEQHGLRFVFETMPAFAKHFDKCLANGRLIKSGLTHMGPFRHDTPIPRLFKGLLLRVFDRFGVLRSDPDVQAIRFVRQLCLAVKRYRVDCPESSTWKHVDEFYRTDSEVRLGSRNWNDDDLGPPREDLHVGDFLDSGPVVPSMCEQHDCTTTDSTSITREHLCTIQLVADMVTSEIGRFDPTEWNPRHGPGAVSDQKGGYKYDFPNWPDKLDASFPYDLFGFSNYDHWVQSISSESSSFENRISEESPSRLIAVPKSFAGPRLIASEPTSHQWCQQIIRDFLTDRVKDTSIDSSISFRDQTPNQVLARSASYSGSHSTIDLSSASDRISCYLVERLFRKSESLVRSLHSVRTRYIVQDIDRKSPSLYQLRKFSTMGSAVTFPMQTYIFTIIAVGSILYERKITPSYRNIRRISKEVRVFGDDMIVPLDSHGSVTGALTLLGLKVNPDKTFFTGKFRESCGYDGYGGSDVTKVSIMSAPALSKPESILSNLDVHNNLYIRGYLRTAEFIRKTVGLIKNYNFMNVPMGSGSLGWYDASNSGNSHLKRRWNPRLQRLEARVTVPQGKMNRIPVERNSALLQYFTEVRSPPISKEVRIGRNELRTPLKLRWSWVLLNPEMV